MRGDASAGAPRRSPTPSGTLTGPQTVSSKLARVRGADCGVRRHD